MQTGPTFARPGGVTPRVHAPAPLHCRLRRVALGCGIAGLIGLCAISACRRGLPSIDTTPRPFDAARTISGTVRGPAGTGPVDGRTVEAIDVDTGERQSVRTSDGGGFTLKLKPGKYRVELALRDGESLVHKPGIIDLNRTGVDAPADFVLDIGRAFRPRGPAYRVDDGLGSPIA